MAIRSSPQLNALRSRGYQGQKAEELSEQQRAEQLRQQDLSNPRRGEFAPAPTQGQLAGAEKPGMFDVDMDAPPAPPSQAEQAAAMAATEGISSRRQPVVTAQGDAARAPAPGGGDQEQKGSIFDTSPEEEKAAFAQELEAQRAKAMQQAEARSGAAGMGLSGATGQLVSDIGRQQTRAGQLAMSEFEQQQAAADFLDVQRKASIWDLEQASDQDFDRDGFRGNPDVGDKPGDPESGVISDQQKRTLGSLEVNDYSVFDPDTEPGTEQEPYKITSNQISALAQQGFQLTLTQKKLGGKPTYIDQYGNYYTVG